MSASLVNWKFDIGDFVRMHKTGSSRMEIVDRYCFESTYASHNMYGCRHKLGSSLFYYNEIDLEVFYDKEGISK
jgi:hypothetical protein